MNQSIIRDPSLAAEGMQRIQWVEKFMPVLNALRKEMKGSSVLKGKTVVMSIHLEAKTAYLALTLQAAGARVIATGSNPLSTQDPIAAGLDSQGICVYATHGCTDQEYTDYLNHALDHHPDLIIDDAGIWSACFTQRVRKRETVFWEDQRKQPPASSACVTWKRREPSVFP